jgi:hypothetical protein
MKRIGRRLDKIEEVLNPRGRRRFSDEEEEKLFRETMDTIRDWPGITEGWIRICLRLFEIEKERAKKENRHLESWWNVLWLMADDRMNFEQRQKIRLKQPGPRMSKEHQERVREFFLQVGHPLGKTM